MTLTFYYSLFFGKGDVGESTIEAEITDEEYKSETIKLWM